MNTNGTAMSVIGNNIANTNTVGFKSSRTVFSDLLASSVNGSGGASQVGRGTGLSTVDNLFSQGTFETTDSQNRPWPSKAKACSWYVRKVAKASFSLVPAPSALTAMAF